jgi:hypothetical protein
VVGVKKEPGDSYYPDVWHVKDLEDGEVGYCAPGAFRVTKRGDLEVADYNTVSERPSVYHPVKIWRTGNGFSVQADTLEGSLRVGFIIGVNAWSSASLHPPSKFACPCCLLGYWIFVRRFQLLRYVFLICRDGHIQIRPYRFSARHQSYWRTL